MPVSYGFKHNIIKSFKYHDNHLTNRNPNCLFGFFDSSLLSRIPIIHHCYLVLSPPMEDFFLRIPTLEEG